MVDPRKYNPNRFQPKPQDKQSEIWYSAIPLDVKWGIYARQSTQAQLINNTESTEMQTDDLIQWLVEKGVRDGNWQLFDADLGVSGTLTITERTGLQELVELIIQGKIKAVLVYQISRLFRDDTGVEYNTFAKICKKHSCVLVTADGMVFDFSNRMHLKMFRFLAEYAAEYIPQQIGLLHAARLRKAKRGFYAGLGSVPRGYIVDYDRDSKDFKKFVPYPEYGTVILTLYERFYQLGGDVSAFCREVEEMPYVFPLYKPWVDRRNIRDKRWKKVPGGYHITKRGLLWLLINPFNIGWLIIQGDIINTKNHTPLIPPEKQYLFWFAFDSLSDFTIKGEVNTKRSITPRRFYQRNTEEIAGLLKNRIESPTGTPVYVHLSEGIQSYCTPKQDTTVYTCSESEIEVSLIDPAFTDLLFSHLRETHDFDTYREWVNEVVQKQATQQEIIHTQLEEIETLQEAILDEKLAIQVQIKKRIKEELEANPNGDEDEIRARCEAEFTRELQRLDKKKRDLEKKEDALQKNIPTEEEEQEVRSARSFADFHTELEILAEKWGKKPFKYKKEFINLLVTKAILSVASTHWVQLTIQWTHPAWNTETLFIYRRRGDRSEWTDEERQIIRTYYPTAKRETVLPLLPQKSWSAIKKEARKLELRRPPQPPSTTLDEFTSWSDYELCQILGIEPTTRDILCFQEDPNTNDSTQSGQPATISSRLVKESDTNYARLS